MSKPARQAAIALAAVAVAAMSMSMPAHAGESDIRKNLAERMPNFPKIDEITKTAIPGVWEIRIGMEVLYTDENGDHIIQGSVFDTKEKVNVTEKRVAKITAIDFKSLPIKDAMVVKQGDGSRKVAIFADPNCGYCKRFERDVLAAKDVTIYTFLYPVLGEDSTAKSRAIWCTKDAQATWRAWMIDGKAPPKTMGECDTGAIDRNVAFGQKYRVNGTPAIIFEDGMRVPGAIPLDRFEKQLADAKAAKPKS
jgi:thiol:disulfide interchange protein DsbC